MKNFTSRIERVLSSRFPVFYYSLIQKPRFWFRFRTERKLVRGALLSQTSRPSVIFFTTQKCASQYVSEVITELAEPAGLVHANYDAYVTMTRVPGYLNPYSANGSMHKAFRPKGYYYGPIGSYRLIERLDAYKAVLQLRDPRDVLTSLYYSTVYSHAVISPKLIRRRKEAAQMDVDEFVLHSIGEYLSIYEIYCKQLLNQKNLLFLKYETMVGEFDSWLNQLATHIGLEDQEKAFNNIRRQADFSVNNEDKYAQRRQVAPGDHRRKLQANTIGQLNDAFKEVLSQLDYLT